MEPIINLDEPIGKTVGRRTAPKDAFRYGMALQKTAVDLDKSLGHRGMPRGVFRFNSFEEADAWMMKHLIRRSRS